MTEEKKGITIPLNITTLLVALLIIAAFFIGSLWTKVQTLEKQDTTTQEAQNPSQPNNPSYKSTGEVEPLVERDHVKGDRNARILLIEYSDFECPFCARFHSTAQKIVDEYDGEIAWVYRHFPLDQLHKKARTEAEASECVYEQGGDEAWWKFTDRIFEITPSNDGLDLDTLPEIATFAGVDSEKFQECLDSGKYKDIIEEDLANGAKAGVTGTPGNILLDTKTGKSRLIPGAVPFAQLKTQIDEMLNEG